MSRVRSAAVLVLICFPRVSGDEPVSHPWGWRAASFSPRERG